MSRLLTGFKAHLWQRLSALWLLLYFPLAIGYVATQALTTYAQLVTVLAQPVFWVATLISFVLIAVHAWVGARDVILDYVPRARVAVSLVALGGLLVIWLGTAMYAWLTVLYQAI